MIKVRDVTVKRISMKYFFIIKEKIAYIECVIQSNMFHSFYLFLSILHCNIDSALVSDSNAYIWISNCIQMFDLYSNVWIYIRMLKECVFSTCPWKMASLDDVGKKISELHQELVNVYKKRFMREKGQVAVVKCSPIWKKNMRKDFKTFPELKSQLYSQIDTWKQEARSASAGKGTLLYLWKNFSRKG